MTRLHCIQLQRSTTQQVNQIQHQHNLDQKSMWESNQWHTIHTKSQHTGRAKIKMSDQKSAS